MGIKFRCPNGHKLNVKSFLAGKRGVCPDCQATFRIPEEPGGSDVLALAIPSLKSGNGAAAEAAAEPVMATTSVVTAAAPVASELAVESVTTLGAAIPAGSAIPVAGGAAAKALAPSAAPAPVAGDPIADAPAAIWYVRPPSGGQYGPARGDVMRKWLAEGRVSGDSLVWREDWTDWRSAGQLFASLGSAAPAGTPIAPAPVAAAPAANRTTARRTVRKKSGHGMAIAALIGLVLVCVALVAVLVVVLTQQSA